MVSGLSIPAQHPAGPRAPEGVILRSSPCALSAAQSQAGWTCSWSPGRQGPAAHGVPEERLGPMAPGKGAGARVSGCAAREDGTVGVHLQTRGSQNWGLLQEQERWKAEGHSGEGEQRAAVLTGGDLALQPGSWDPRPFPGPDNFHGNEEDGRWGTGEDWRWGTDEDGGWWIDEDGGWGTGGDGEWETGEDWRWGPDNCPLPSWDDRDYQGPEDFFEKGWNPVRRSWAGEVAAATGLRARSG